jgi:2-amino-4-hydroxy-6-hydroxymethyldihydropteridine diphosphokinase
LDYDGRVMAEPGLTLPHPRITTRSFVLVPLRDVAPDWRHPVTGQGLAELLEALPDRDTPKRLP